MGRTMWWVGLLGWLVFGAAGVQGFGLGDLARDVTGFEPHLLLGALGALLIAVSGGWMSLYLALTGRLLRRTPTVGGEGDLARSVARGSRWAVPLTAAAVAAAVATVTLSVQVFTGHWPTWGHLALGAGALLLQGTALVLLWPLLGRHEDLIRRTDRALEGSTTAG